MNIVLKGRIIPTQNMVGNVLTVPKSVDGNINNQKQIGGIVSTQTQRLSGTVKNPSHIHGIISKPSGRGGQCDHVFVIVDLIKFHEQQTLINSANTILPLTAQNLQAISRQININTVPTTITVNSMTANNISFSAENIMVNEEVYSNANE